MVSLLFVVRWNAFFRRIAAVAAVVFVVLILATYVRLEVLRIGGMISGILMRLSIAAALTAWIGFAMLIVGGWLKYFVRCPNCGQWYSRKGWYQNPWRTSCIHCGYRPSATAATGPACENRDSVSDTENP
jgi:hypothetical protein